MPMPIIGSAAPSMLTRKPISATSQPVIVVPTFAPKSTQSDWLKVSRPALTKPMAATVTALDDWTSAVTSIPENSPRSRVSVDVVSTLPSAGPAAIFKPSVIKNMPSRNNPTPPARKLRATPLIAARSLASAWPG